MLYSKSIHVGVVDETTLDELLAQGWYRAGSRFFTSAFLLYQGQIYNTIWLRINLHGFEWSSKMKELAKRNQGFEVTFCRFVIDEEMSELFRKYRKNTNFIQSSTLAEYVHGSSIEVNDALLHCVKLYDGYKLIGCGVYEEGNTSYEGLVSFYDGEYKKYSPGRYLMMCKINKALKEKMKYFYTGYYVPGQSKFDYKLSISPRHLECFDPQSDLWYPFKEYNGFTDELSITKEASDFIAKHLQENGIRSKTMVYPFFEYNIHTYFGYAIPLTIPYMVIIDPDESLNNDNFNIVVFDIRNEVYRVYNVEYYGTFYTQPYREYKDYFSDALLVINSEFVCGDYRTIVEALTHIAEQDYNQ